MPAPDPILSALERLEERVVQRIDDSNRELLRDLRLELRRRFDELEERLPSD